MGVHKIFETSLTSWQTCFGALISVSSQRALLYEENQQSGLSNALQGAAVLWVLPSFKDKTLNPETPSALNCRGGLWSSCLFCIPGICCSHVHVDTHMHKHTVFFPLKNDNEYNFKSYSCSFTTWRDNVGSDTYLFSRHFSGVALGRPAMCLARAQEII